MRDFSDPENRDLVQAAVQAAIESAPQNYDSQTSALVEAARADPELRAAIAEPRLEELCRDLIRAHGQRIRAQAWRIRATPDPEKQREAGERRARASARTSLLMFPLWDGTPLGEANKAKVLEAANQYEKRADDAAHKSRFLALVAARMGRARKVANALDDARLNEIFQESRHASA